MLDGGLAVESPHLGDFPPALVEVCGHHEVVSLRQVLALEVGLGEGEVRSLWCDDGGDPTSSFSFPSPVEVDGSFEGGLSLTGEVLVGSVHEFNEIDLLDISAEDGPESGFFDVFGESVWIGIDNHSGSASGVYELGTGGGS